MKVTNLWEAAEKGDADALRRFLRVRPARYARALPFAAGARRTPRARSAKRASRTWGNDAAALGSRGSLWLSKGGGAAERRTAQPWVEGGVAAAGRGP